MVTIVEEEEVVADNEEFIILYQSLDLNCAIKSSYFDLFSVLYITLSHPFIGIDLPLAFGFESGVLMSNVITVLPILSTI